MGYLEDDVCLHRRREALALIASWRVPNVGDDDVRSAPAQRGLVERLIALADRPLGAAILVVLALLEATIFPGPTEAMLVALILGRRERAVWFATLATASSVVGGVAG